MKKALVTGGAGFLGSHLCKRLLADGYEVTALDNLFTGTKENIYELLDDKRFSFVLHDVTQPFWGQFDEIYNLAAQSHVRVSFDSPEFTGDVDALGTMRLLEAIRLTGRAKLTKFYQASTSELFGLVQEVPQKETTPFYPRSPYAVAKLYSYWAVRNYREAYGLFAANGILFNHESPRRGETFVTRKITRAVGRIKMGLQDKLFMGNIEAKRDWGYAADYVEGMWRILQHSKPDDFVLATGEMHSVREFLEAAFGAVDLDWHDYVDYDARYMRPSEVDQLLGDASKAKRELGWEPRVRFKELVKIMVDADLKLAEREKRLNG